MLGTTVLLTCYLEAALRAVDQIQRQKVPKSAKRKALCIAMERLYTQLEPERLALLAAQAEVS